MNGGANPDDRREASAMLEPHASKPLVLFIIPLVARSNCHSWTDVCERLQATIDSIANQTCSDWHVMIVGNDRPEVRIDPARATLLTSDFRLKSDRPGARELDKQNKIQFGLLSAKPIQPEYVMFLDADDRLSDRLVDYIRANSHLDGFLISNGYLHRTGSDWLVVLRQFHMSCGSCYLFRYREAEMPSSMDQSRENFWMISAHNKHVADHFRKQGYQYAEVPFPAAIYMRGHVDSTQRLMNLSQTGGLKSQLRRVSDSARRFARLLVRGRRITKATEREFGTLS